VHHEPDGRAHRAERDREVDVSGVVVGGEPNGGDVREVEGLEVGRLAERVALDVSPARLDVALARSREAAVAEDHDPRRGARVHFHENSEVCAHRRWASHGEMRAAAPEG
jgi:hypothetical protein